ncbi:hypothetical protein SAMN02745248_01501 [Hathewaya proteolytica DSM 3090]|uniref:Uncharacterized protein n=1 Tax=Hathewaya proteolytica DSM 3090 TaxID=1121331 RepID=A0A1M6NUG3_9CLOT|nr:hypothetical protein [Hathewaya proteolytica]SHJ99340.1 hypothetical protein SAMN02745248_01501 [Hathewaya proteolytica DSM 3090]
MNEISELNFNETCRGYLIRALKNVDLEEHTDKVLEGLRWAFDEMSFEDARKERSR